MACGLRVWLLQLSQGESLLEGLAGNFARPCTWLRPSQKLRGFAALNPSSSDRPANLYKGLASIGGKMNAKIKRLASGRAVFCLIRCASVCIDAHCDDTDKDDMVCDDSSDDECNVMPTTEMNTAMMTGL